MSKTESEALSIERRLTELRAIASERATAKSRLDYLDHFRKSKLAMLMKEYAQEHKTTAAQEREARCDNEYLEILEGLAEATEIYERLDWELRIAMKGADLWQTTQANRRQEMREYMGK